MVESGADKGAANSRREEGASRPRGLEGVVRSAHSCPLFEQERQKAYRNASQSYWQPPKRIYYTLTADFESFTPARLLFDSGYSTIDATVLRSEGHHRMEC